MNQKPIFFYLDLEVEFTKKRKFGLPIFDLAIISDGFVFESNQLVNFKISRPLNFEDYVPVMLDELYRYCQKTPHSEIYFIAHNGFNHDFTILFDNLERSGFLDLFIELFEKPENTFFLDTLVFFNVFCFKNYIKIEKTLSNLYNKYVLGDTQKQIQQHIAKSDAEMLSDLMKVNPNKDSTNPYGLDSCPFIDSILKYDRPKKNISEFYLYYKEKKEEFEWQAYKEDLKGYDGIAMKQLKADLARDGIFVDVGLLINRKLNYNWFYLVELGGFSKEKIENTLSQSHLSVDDQNLIADWCKRKSNYITNQRNDERIIYLNEEHKANCLGS